MTTGFFDFHARIAQGKRGRPAQSNASSTDGGNAAPQQVPQPAALTVSELNAKITNVVRANFITPLWVKGEISGYRGPQSSGHHYFCLKDASNSINCVVWASEARAIRFKWSDGMEVLAQGCVATYPARSQYQLKVSQLLPVGQGSLELAFRQLKERLEREGLFAQERKKPIPPFPRRIALVTSRGAAGFADMLKVLGRFPWLKLMLFHVPVQGDGAHPAIAAALTAVNRHAQRLGGIDVIVLGRGGGSPDDLWAFNEECVARAMSLSQVPIVTGIGHEVDVSIADLVADYHAHTPTEAAQIVTQHWRVARSFVEQAGERLGQLVRQRVRRSAEQLLAIRRHESFRKPVEQIVRSRQQLVDDLHKTTKLALRVRFDVLRDRLSSLDCRLQIHRPTALLAQLRERVDCLAARLAERHPRHLTGRLIDRLNAAEGRLRASMRQMVGRHATRLDALTRELDAVGPLQVLRRGYTITMRKKDRVVIRDPSEIRKGDRMITRFAEGEYEWTAGDGQMSLF